MFRWSFKHICITCEWENLFCKFFTNFFQGFVKNHVNQFALVIRFYLFPIYTDHHFLPNAHCPLICIKHQLLFPIEAAGGLLQNIFPRNHTHFSGGPIYIHTCGKRCITTSNIDDGLPLFSGGFQFSAEVAAEVGAQGQWSSAAGDWCWWWLPWWWWWWFWARISILWWCLMIMIMVVCFVILIVHDWPITESIQSDSKWCHNEEKLN